MIYQQQMRRAKLAVVALGLIGAAPSAFAAGTDFSTPITNTASVNYSVSSVPQTVINSSPTGNSTPGVSNGTATSFLVDKKVIFIAEETDGAPTRTSPGLTGVVTVFRVTNTSNGAQSFRLLADNSQPPPPDLFGNPDVFDMSGFSTHISAASCSTATMTTPTYVNEASVTRIEQLPEDTCVYVFVRSDTPVAAANGQASTIRLAVTAAKAITDNGGADEAETVGADVAGSVDVVFAEAGVANGNVAENGISLAFDQYLVGTLTVTKTAAVLNDGFSPAGQAKAIPGAIVEYTISVQNNGLDTTGANMTEVIPPNTTYIAGSTTLNGVAVADVSGAMPYVGGGAINSPGQPAGVIVLGATAAQIAVVRFRVTIN